MKFLATQNLKYSKLYAYLMGAIVIAILLYLILDIVLHFSLFGIDIQTIKNTLFGNLETFEEPILIDSLLLQVHIDFFMTLFSLLILASIYIRLQEKSRFLKPIVHSLFLAGMFTPLFLLGAYFLNELFLYLWIVGFLSWHTFSVIVSIVILKKLDFR